MWREGGGGYWDMCGGVCLNLYIIMCTLSSLGCACRCVNSVGGVHVLQCGVCVGCACVTVGCVWGVCMCYGVVCV